MPENFKTGEKIGQGFEKEVYRDRENPDRVIGLRRNKESSETIKARFYLTKILHMLFPKNIPDISLSMTNPNADKRSYVRVHEGHKPISRAQYGDLLEDKRPISTEEYAESRAERGKIYLSPAFQELISTFEKLHIFIDRALVNFTFDSEGNVVYFDDVYLPSEREGSDTIAALRGAIENRLSDSEKEKALRYLNRFCDLVKSVWKQEAL